MIIGIVGVKGSGKDYTADNLMKVLEDPIKIGFSDGVREHTFKELGLPNLTGVEYDEFKNSLHSPPYEVDFRTGRYWLEYFGEGLRALNPYIWSEKWKAKCLGENILHKNVIAQDCRFKHEVKAILDVSCSTNQLVKFIFADYHSERYDDSYSEVNKMALHIRNLGHVDGDDITEDVLNYNP